MTVVKEDKIKYTYELNKEKKVVSSVDKIYFKIDKKEEKKYNINPITSLASDMNLSIEEALQGVRYLQNYLKEKDGIYLDEIQIINLYKISCQDATLVYFPQIVGGMLFWAHVQWVCVFCCCNGVLL